jgi:hypothetical protein
MYATATMPAARAAMLPADRQCRRGANTSSRSAGLIRANRTFNRRMNSGDGSISGRLRTSMRLRRIRVSCREQREHAVRCCCIASISKAGSTSSTNATCLFRNARQSIRGNSLRVTTSPDGTRLAWGGSRTTKRPHGGLSRNACDSTSSSGTPDAVRVRLKLVSRSSAR